MPRGVDLSWLLIRLIFGSLTQNNICNRFLSALVKCNSVPQLFGGDAHDADIQFLTMPKSAHRCLVLIRDPMRNVHIHRKAKHVPFIAFIVTKSMGLAENPLGIYELAWSHFLVLIDSCYEVRCCRLHAVGRAGFVLISTS